MNSPCTPKSNLSIRWQFLPWGYRAQYDFEAPVTEGSVQKVAEALVRSVLPEECRSHDTITDLRGRDPQLPLLLTDGGAARPAYEELFFLAGERKPSDEEAAAEESESMLPFDTTLYTKFLEFNGASHIVHSIAKLHHGFDDEKPNLLELTINPDVAILSARLGFELFEKSVLVFLGLTPGVVQTLTIECNRTKFAMRILSEALSRRNSLPLQQRGIFPKLSQAIHDLFNFDLEADYRARAR